MSLRLEARAAIYKAHDSVPHTATMRQRVFAIDNAYPFAVRDDWPMTAWLRERRDYIRVQQNFMKKISAAKVEQST